MPSGSSTATSVIRTTAGRRSTFYRRRLFGLFIKAVVAYRFGTKILVGLFFLSVFGSNIRVEGYVDTLIEMCVPHNFTEIGSR